MGGNNSKNDIQNNKNPMRDLIENINISSKTEKIEWKGSLKELDQQSKEFQNVQKICFIPYEIVKIQKVYNKWLFLRYVAQKCFYFLRNNHVDEEVVFHGSESDPVKISTDNTGFDFRTNAFESNSWGQALKFSTDVTFSLDTSFKEGNLSSIILAKLLIGRVKEIDHEMMLQTELRSLIKNVQGVDLFVLILKKTQKVFTYIDNYNMLPLYIITFDTSKAVQIEIPKRWLRVDEVGHFKFLPKEIDSEIHEQFRHGIEKKDIKFKLNIDDTEEQTYDVNIENQYQISLRNKTNNETILLQSGELKNIMSNLKSPFFTNLNQDFQILHKYYGSFQFPNDTIKNSVLETFDELSNLLIQDDGTNLVTQLDINDQEYKMVSDEFHKTIPKSDATILKIEKIHNKLLKAKYLTKKILIALKSGCINETFDFHGSLSCPPDVIYNGEVGFEMRMAGDENLWGKGIYFAVDAVYSYSYKDYMFENKKYDQLFLASILLGKRTPEKQIKENRRLTKAPEDYDSVWAHTRNNDIYVVYENSMAYPSYLITYKRFENL